MIASTDGGWLSAASTNFLPAKDQSFVFLVKYQALSGCTELVSHKNYLPQKAVGQCTAVKQVSSSCFSLISLSRGQLKCLPILAWWGSAVWNIMLHKSQRIIFCWLFKHWPQKMLVDEELLWAWVSKRSHRIPADIWNLLSQKPSFLMHDWKLYFN